ncbi:MAG: hypothetical protein U9R64_15015, partial [Pseudomonadota bacterium]|nr:hypothetical protein [Pseudomonadota bacterium]
PNWNTIYFDTSSGITGTGFPNGTRSSPVDNITDARAIAVARNIEKIHVHGSITLNDNFDGFSFESDNPLHGSITLNNQSIANCSFNKLSITGQANGNAQYRDCRMQACTDLSGGMVNSRLTDNISIKAGATCHAKNVSTAGVTPINIDMSGTGTSFQGVPLNGQITIKNLEHSSSWIIIIGTNNIILDSSITAGTVFVAGGGNLTDNSTSITNLVNNLTADQTWDILKTSHTTTDTYGKIVADTEIKADDAAVFALSK